LLACRTVMWTPHVLTTPRELEREVEFRCGGLTDDIESAFHPDYDPELMFDFDDARHTELFIVGSPVVFMGGFVRAGAGRVRRG
jgi:hypothetical protein